MPLSELKAMLRGREWPTRCRASESKLSHERADAMDYLPRRHGARPAGAGRAPRAVSTDVADTIEGLMPSLWIFCGGDEWCASEPAGPQDVQAAEQETDYVKPRVPCSHPGFLILYSFIKRADLEGRRGQVWWGAARSRNARPITISRRCLTRCSSPIPDVGSWRTASARSTGDRRRTARPSCWRGGRCRPMPASTRCRPRNSHRRIARSLREADYCFHKVLVGEARLIAQGFDADRCARCRAVRHLQQREIARDSVDESGSRATASTRPRGASR